MKSSNNHLAGKKREEKPKLWSFTIPPIIWSLHFLACYITASVWCAKVAENASDFMIVRVAIAIYTALALTFIFLQATKGRRLFKQQGLRQLPHSDDTIEDRNRFLAFVIILICFLSAVATLFVGFTGIIFRSCN